MHNGYYTMRVTLYALAAAAVMSSMPQPAAAEQPRIPVWTSPDGVFPLWTTPMDIACRDLQKDLTKAYSEYNEQCGFFHEDVTPWHPTDEERLRCEALWRQIENLRAQMRFLRCYGSGY